MSYVKKLVYVGAPIQTGQELHGPERAPDALREAGLLDRIKNNIGCEVQDLGNSPLITGEKDPKEKQKAMHAREVSLSCGKLAEIVTKAAEKQEDFVLTVGGDHSIAMGSITGILASRPDTCVIWVDAHGDINTPMTSDSGHIHGMPVAALLGEFTKEDMDAEGLAWLEPRLDPKRIAYIGLRDIDQGEKEIIKRLGIATYTMHEVDKYGMDSVVRMALDKINPDRVRPIHVSFDVDGLDPEQAPSTGTKVLGGLTFREARYMLEEIVKTRLFRSMDLVEINPIESPAYFNYGDERVNLTVAVGMELVLCALGHTLFGL